VNEERGRRGGLTGTVIRGVSLAGSGYLLGRAITLVTFIVLARLVTPELTGTILEGVTRSSILELAKEQGLDVEERRLGIEEWREGVASGAIAEVFACGTAAVVTPVGRLVWDGGEVGSADAVGEVTARIRQALVDIQYGRAEDTHSWMRRLA